MTYRFPFGLALLGIEPAMERAVVGYLAVVPMLLADIVDFYRPYFLKRLAKNILWTSFAQIFLIPPTLLKMKLVKVINNTSSLYHAGTKAESTPLPLSMITHSDGVLH